MGVVLGINGGDWGSDEKKFIPFETQMATFLYPKLKDSISKEDLLWLCGKLRHTTVSDSTWQALLVKLKLEFGEELAKHNAAVELSRRKEQERYRKEQEKREEEAANYKKAVAPLRVKERALQEQFIALERFLDRNYVRSMLHVPDALRSMYLECERQGIIEQPWFRRYRVVGRYTNPITAEIRKLDHGRRYHYYDGF